MNWRILLPRVAMAADAETWFAVGEPHLSRRNTSLSHQGRPTRIGIERPPF